MLKNENGVTLIMLVVTVIVMLILATATFDFSVQDSIIEKSVNAKFETEVAALLERWNMEKAAREMKGIKLVDMNYTMEEALPDQEVRDDFKKKFRIKKGEMVFISTECSKDEIETLERMRIYGDI